MSEDSISRAMEAYSVVIEECFMSEDTVHDIWLMNHPDSGKWGFLKFVIRSRLEAGYQTARLPA